MIRYRRPEQPADFEPRVADAKEAIRRAVEVEGRNPASKEFDDLWKHFKSHFEVAQHEKCFFCEGLVTATQDGDVEHFFPKAGITTLGPWHETGKGSKTKKLSERGYWWLAYEWTNYSLACQKCNQRNKGNHFPTSPEIGEEGPSINDNRIRLLLNAFDDVVEESLSFNQSGFAVPLDDRGRMTIRVCGLNRSALVSSRFKQLRLVQGKLDQLIQALADNNATRIKEVASDLEIIGADDWPFAGQTRALVSAQLQISWDELKLLAAD